MESSPEIRTLPSPHRIPTQFDFPPPPSYDSLAMYICRECEEPLNQAMEVCPHCGADLTTPNPEDAPTPKKKSNLIKSIVIWGILITSVWAIIWFVLPPRPESSKGEAEKSALAAIADVRAALLSYSAATGGFPPSMESLGDTARSAIQTAKSAGYEIQYTPANTDDSGRIKSFVLLARPGNFGYRNFYADETPVIHETTANRPATPQDPELQ